MRLTTRVLAALIAAFASIVPGPATMAFAAEEALPPIHCVADLRAARIAGESGKADAELAALRGAVETCPGEVAPILALLDYGARHEMPAADLDAFRATLLRRLTNDCAAELPLTALRQIAADRDGADADREVR